jgi:protein-S-isoprenylcysteine O-methyltransferase Ste14
MILGVLVGAVGTSGYFRRRARIEGGTIARREEGALFVALRALVSLPILAGVLAYLVNPGWMAWSAFDAPGWLRLVGAGLGIACLPSVYWVLTSLGKNVSETVLTKPDHELVTAGPYRWVRHPLYTTGLTLLLAIALMAANWALLLLAALSAVLILAVVIPREEAALTARFGDEYRRYMMRTGRLLPRVFRAP